MFLGVPESVTLSACTEQAEKQHVTSTNGKQYWCGCGTHAQMMQAQHGTHALNHTGGSSRGWAGHKTGILASVLRGKRVIRLFTLATTHYSAADFKHDSRLIRCHSIFQRSTPENHYPDPCQAFGCLLKL
jgi:hypothetical protein